MFIPSHFGFPLSEKIRHCDSETKEETEDRQENLARPKANRRSIRSVLNAKKTK
jgi:hypothetical protein